VVVVLRDVPDGDPDALAAAFGKVADALAPVAGSVEMIATVNECAGAVIKAAHADVPVFAPSPEDWTPEQVAGFEREWAARYGDGKATPRL